MVRVRVRVILGSLMLVGLIHKTKQGGLRMRLVFGENICKKLSNLALFV